MSECGSNLRVRCHRKIWMLQEELGSLALVHSQDFDTISAVQPFRRGQHPRVLLLTSGLGLGHVRAAEAIKQALKSEAEVTTLDMWSLMNAGVAAVAHATYLRLVQDHTDLYERLYQLNDRTWRQILESEDGPPPEVLEVLGLISDIIMSEAQAAPRGGRYASDRLLMLMIGRALPYEPERLAGNGVRARLALMKWAWMRLIRRLEIVVQRCRPDVIVSTQMMPAGMISHLKGKRKIGTPMIGVITDFGVHDFWRQAGIDCYSLAHESLLESKLLPDSKVASGVPLMPNFTYPVSQAEARRQLELPSEGPIVLVLGGGLGLSVDHVAAELVQEQSGAHLVVLPGRNQAARAALDRLAVRHPGRLTVREWTERMDLYLRACDIVVGKPGGISVAECLACGRPLLASRSLGGQEGHNVNFLARHDVGGLVADGELLTHVMDLLRNRDRLQSMQRRAWLLGRRDGARKVADLAMDFVARHQAVASR
jgi:processive 1,2-diacylglycerol beta-glucosyltransferase